MPIPIVLTGGGSGGHITPVLSVAHELKQLEPRVKVVYIGQRGEKVGALTENNPSIDVSYKIYAGKLRRYHGESLARQLLDIRTQLLNLRDVIYLVVGFLQSWWLLWRIKPKALFVKGGFVGVPVATAARLRGIPYITHDSDAMPGLANRLIAGGAAWHATGMPAELYRYPLSKTVHTGVPVSSKFKPLTDDEIRKAKTYLGIDSYRPVLLVIGGGLGARRVNKLMAEIAPSLFNAVPNLYIIHITGHTDIDRTKEQYQKARMAPDSNKLFLADFTTEVHTYSAAADLIITRAGATALAEFAAQSKACIVIPNPHLTGGHQLKNAKPLADANAIVLFNEKGSAEQLTTITSELLNDPKRRQSLGNKLAKFASLDASRKLAELILKVK